MFTDALATPTSSFRLNVQERTPADKGAGRDVMETNVGDQEEELH